MTDDGKLQCPTCPGRFFPSAFKTPTGKPRKRCFECTQKVAKWGKASAIERKSRVSSRDGLSLVVGAPKFKLALRSQNPIIGPIPVTGSQPNTCPPSCGLYGAGCYAEQGILGIVWRRLARGDGGMPWGAFLEAIRRLPRGQLWRHNEMGDLRGEGEELDRNALWELVRAADGQRGFTYTHKRRDLKMVRLANENGFTVNISTETPEQADEYSSEGCPVTTVLPHDASVRGNMTPGRLPIVVCPAEYEAGKQCASCGMCQDRTRGFIIGFRAQGEQKKAISARQNKQLPLFQERK